MTEPAPCPSLKVSDLDPGRKTHRRGTERTQSPAATLARVRPHLAAIGITRVANVTGLDRIGIPVVMVCRPDSRSVSVFQGKGADLDAARASGVMEAIETFHGERVLNPLKLASYEDLRRHHRALDARALAQSAQGYFHRRRPLLWTEGFDLVREEPVWLPYDAVHADFSTNVPCADSGLRVSTNGLASGNGVLEAISHGLCEVIERDATTLWNFLDTRGRQATEVDADSVDDDLCRRLIRQCRRAGLSVRIWDATSDIGLPVQVAELREIEPPITAGWARPSFGSGCHAARGVALARALTEAAQVRTTFIAGARDDMSWGDYEGDPEPVLAPRTGSDGEPGYRRFTDIGSWSSDTVRDDVLRAIERLRRVGLEQVVVVDLRQPEFDLPVVRVVVPGLEGPDEHYPDYVPGPRARALVTSLQRGRRSS